MSLRVLVWSNPLVVDKISHQFRYDADSGFIFTKHLISKLPKTWRYTWVIPDKIKESDWGWFSSANEIVELMPYPYPTNIHQARYEFAGDVLRNNFEYGHDIDVILNNQPEVSASLRAWASNQRREHPIILSFYHWLDVPDSAQFGRTLSGYFWRQWDGYLASDSAFFHNRYAFDLFSEEVERKVVESSDLWKTRTGTFNPPATEFGKEPYPMPEEKVILFNHRLNNTTNWKHVVETLEKLWDTRKDFCLWLTDEDGSSLHKQYLKKFPFIHVERIPEQSYGYVMENSHFAVCAHKGYSTWNMAILDSIRNGLFTLVPNDGIYREMLLPFNELMWHNFGDDLYVAMSTLLNADARTLRTMNEEVQRFVISQYSWSSAEILEHIFAHVQLRMGDKPPKKYSDVWKYIKNSETPVEKRDWVNKFWSFHVNSNFQKIRWWLLFDGNIRDITEEHRTTYTYDG